MSSENKAKKDGRFMRLTDKTERWSMGDKKFVGKRKNYNVNIHFAAKNYMNENEYWWYSIQKDDIGFAYNSLWDSLKFNSKEECVKEAEDKVDELVKINKI